MKSQQSLVKTAAAAVLSASVVIAGLGALEFSTNSAFADPMPSPSATPRKKKISKKPIATEELIASADGGTNGGRGTGRASGLGDVTAWCRGSVGILNFSKDQAVPALTKGKYASALTTLTSGVSQAIEAAEESDHGKSLTLSTLERIHLMGDALYSAMVESEVRDQMVVLFYIEAYDFVKKVADEIDIPVFIPYARENREFDPVAYRQHFADYGSKQLQWLLKNFTYESTEQYYAYYDQKIYLTLAESVVAGVAQDLSATVFGNAYSCQVQDLKYLATNLAKHNGGDQEVYQGDDKIAVNSSVGRIKAVIQNLKTGCSHAAF